MLMVGVISSYATVLDINIITMAAMLLVASQMAMFLPGASYYAGMVHGQAARLGRKNGFVWGFVVMLATACAIPIMLMIGNVLFA